MAVGQSGLRLGWGKGGDCMPAKKKTARKPAKKMAKKPMRKTAKKTVRKTTKKTAKRKK